jgi:hypothetical protein
MLRRLLYCMIYPKSRSHDYGGVTRKSFACLNDPEFGSSYCPMATVHL